MSLVPTSAITGDGMGDLIALIVKLSQTMLSSRLAYSNEVECSVMEVDDNYNTGNLIFLRF